MFDLSTIPGNPFVSPNAADGHNSFSIAVTKAGHILVTGNEHVNECRCVISASPHDISAWRILSYTDDKVTYPRFIQYPDGTTQIFWRQGTSGNGTYYMNTFDDSTLLFGSKALVISAPDGEPYEQTICVDNKGVLHLCWGIGSPLHQQIRTVDCITRSQPIKAERSRMQRVISAMPCRFIPGTVSDPLSSAGQRIRQPERRMRGFIRQLPYGLLAAG